MVARVNDVKGVHNDKLEAVQGGNLETAQRGGNIFSEYAHGGLPIPCLTTPPRTSRAAPEFTKEVEAEVLKKPVPSTPPPPPALQRGRSAASMSGQPPPQNSPLNQSSPSTNDSSALFHFDSTGISFDHDDSGGTGDLSHNLLESCEVVRQSPDDASVDTLPVGFAAVQVVGL